jgi:hypothetical protein
MACATLKIQPTITYHCNQRTVNPFYWIFNPIQIFPQIFIVYPIPNPGSKMDRNYALNLITIQYSTIIRIKQFSNPIQQYPGSKISLSRVGEMP